MLGFGPEPGGGGSTAGSGGWADSDGRADKPEASARAVVAAADGVGTGRRVQQRLGAEADFLRGQHPEAVVRDALRLVAPEAGPRRLPVRASEPRVRGGAEPSPAAPSAEAAGVLGQHQASERGLGGGRVRTVSTAVPI